MEVAVPSSDVSRGTVSPYRLLTARADDWDDIVCLQSEAFHEEIGEAWASNQRLVVEPERTLPARTSSGEAAGTSSVCTREPAVRDVRRRGDRGARRRSHRQPRPLASGRRSGSGALLRDGKRFFLPSLLLMIGSFYYSRRKHASSVIVEPVGSAAHAD